MGLMTSTEIDIRRFAERVERLCDFLLSRVEINNDNADTKFVQDLRTDAADFQFESLPTILTGLDEYVKGLPAKEQ